MKKLLGIILALLMGVSILSGCMTAKDDTVPAPTPLPEPAWHGAQPITNDNYMHVVDEYDIQRSTDALGGAAAKYYSKYIDYTAPNGKPIRILAMDGITDDQLLYAYNLLSFYLRSDTMDKAAIANAMADNEATLIMPNGADRDGRTPMSAMIGQNLNYAETANIGSPWYIDCDYEHRDAAFEEIFHLVHDYGIGTSQHPVASPDIMQKIADATYNALPLVRKDWGTSGIWGVGFDDAIDEWEREGSLEQEYIVSVIDSYYGLWEPWTEGEGGMWGGYVVKTRSEILEKDPVGHDALASYLPPYITSMMRIDPAFDGVFSMTRDQAVPYTAKSQYLQYVTLTGSQDSGIIGNGLDNVLMGNRGHNEIDGQEGQDVIQLRGAQAEYTVDMMDGQIVITDQVDGRDGTITCVDVEIIRFIDVDVVVG